MSQDVMLTVMNSISLNNDFVNMEMQECESYEKCLNLDVELSKSKQAYNDFLKNYSQLKKHCISLEASMQLQQEVFQNDESCVNQNAVEIQEYFEVNDLKSRLHDKDNTICKLKDTIKSLRENTKEENVNPDKCDLERDLSIHPPFTPTLIPLRPWDFPVIVPRACGKKLLKMLYTHLLSLLFAPGMFKLDLVPLPPSRKAKAKQPLDSELDFTCKYAIRIQEFLVYVQDTCPNAITPSPKKVAITPMNKVKKVRFAEPLTSSSNSKHVESSNTSDSNTHVLSSIGVKCSTSNCGSKPPGNKRNDRISQTPSRNKKNKVEAQPRKVNKINCVVNLFVMLMLSIHCQMGILKFTVLLVKKSMFDGVHDKCLLDLVQNGNNRFKWKPIGRTFTIVGNSCPLTRFTSTNVVPPKKTTSHSDEIQKPEIKVYSRKPKNVKNIGSSIIAKIVESKNANHSELDQTWGSNATDIPSSSSLVMTGTVRFWNDQIARIMGYGDYQLGNVVILRVYYVEGLGHNLFSVGQFCDVDLEVAF
ncbi:hypothetical protein Tco_0091670 [Tanacetum coccineum]